MFVHVWTRRKVTYVKADHWRRGEGRKTAPRQTILGLALAKIGCVIFQACNVYDTQTEWSEEVNSVLPGKNVSTISVHCSLFRLCLAAWQVIIYILKILCAPLQLLEQHCLFHPDNINGCQLRDGWDSWDHILRDQQPQLGPEKDRVFPHWQSRTHYPIALLGNAFYCLFRQASLRATVAPWNCHPNPIISKQIKNDLMRNTSRQSKLITADNTD